MDWKRQGKAIVGGIALTDGRTGRVVLVADRTNPKGAMIILPGASPDDLETTPLFDHIAALDPRQLTDILIMQERVFGKSHLPAPDVL